MKFKGTLIGEASGSIASLTASHNRGGQYFRQRAVPVNPNTTSQQAVKSYFAQLTTRWSNTLTAAQRDAWNEYALQVPMPDSLGAPRNIGGLGMYVRCNVPRLYNTVAVVDNGPTNYTLPTFTNPVFAAPDVSLNSVSMAFTNTDAWAGEAGGYMFVYISSGNNASINYFKGPYRLAGKVTGSGTPPTSPSVITMPLPFGVGQRVFFRVNVSRADGRLSGDFRGFNVAVA